MDDLQHLRLIWLSISALIFFSYVIWIYTRYGILPSISDSYYQLEDNLRPLFTMALWGFAIPAMMAGECGLMFLSGSGICFVGAAPLFRERLEGNVHVIGAVTGVLAGMLSLVLVYHIWWIPVYLLYVL